MSDFSPDVGPRRGRGNVYDRRRRRARLLSTFGDGTTCSCAHCGKTLTERTVQSDRIIPGTQGGTYRFSNLVPSCGPCNASRGDRADWLPRGLSRRLTAATGP